MGRIVKVVIIVFVMQMLAIQTYANEAISKESQVKNEVVDLTTKELAEEPMEIEVSQTLTDKVELGSIVNLRAREYGKGRVLLTYDVNSQADGYLIYGIRGTNPYGYVGMTTNAYFVDEKALDKEYNYYWVTPFRYGKDNKIEPGTMEKYVYAKGVCQAVTNLKAMSYHQGVRLTWTSVEGAMGYLIYGIRGDGVYEYIGINDYWYGSTFTDTKALQNQYNFYWVYPYHYSLDGKMIPGGTPKYVYGKKTASLAEQSKAIWDDFFKKKEYISLISTTQYIDASNLEYAMIDINKDELFEVVMQSRIYGEAWSDTWVFTIRNGKAVLEHHNYGYGELRYIESKQQVIGTSNLKPNYFSSSYSFYQVSWGDFWEVFTVQTDGDKAFLRNSAGTFQIRKEAVSGYFEGAENLKWTEL